MADPACSDDDFISLFEREGPNRTAEILKVGERAVYLRRSHLENKIGRQITAPDNGGNFRTRQHVAHPYRVEFDIADGVILVASDCHYWPDRITTAHRAFVQACKELKPKAVIMNGDVLDGARISRHPPIGWESRPTLIDEIETCKKRLDEIRDAAKNAKLIWTLGNHCARFETRLATVAPEYARMHGFHLQDHFPEFEPGWACWINGEVVVKHRFKGGQHAAFNNTVSAGKTIVTGHLHSLKVTPFTDYVGMRWGVETGTLADVYGEQFVDYTEDSPRSWQSGFAVLTFHRGKLLPPELVHVIADGQAAFRGKLYHV